MIYYIINASLIHFVKKYEIFRNLSFIDNIILIIFCIKHKIMSFMTCNSSASNKLLSLSLSRIAFNEIILNSFHRTFCCRIFTFWKCKFLISFTLFSSICRLIHNYFPNNGRTIISD